MYISIGMYFIKNKRVPQSETCIRPQYIVKGMLNKCILKVSVDTVF